MAATSICQKFNLKLIALLCCCHHDCSCYTLFMAAGQHLQHIFQMPSSYFAHAGGIRIQEGRGWQLTKLFARFALDQTHSEYANILDRSVQVDSATRPEIMFASPNYSNRCCGKCPGRGRQEGSACRDGNTAHASVNSRCQCVKLQGVIEGKRSG